MRSETAEMTGKPGQPQPGEERQLTFGVPMARRTGLPTHIRHDLDNRAKAGFGHDPDAPTMSNGTSVAARLAKESAPSTEMLGIVREVRLLLTGLGASHIDTVPDLRNNGTPGDLTVRWHGQVPAKAIATHFATSTTLDGTPRIPAWLSLRADDDFDLRWQPAF